MANRIPSRVSVLERRSDVQLVAQAPRTILVVDDEEGARGFVERVLQSAGYATVVVANGPEALRAAATMPTLDMVIADVMMPDMSGGELVRRLRRDHPDVKVLYATGYRDQLFDEKVMMWEDEAFIDKPCSAKALLEAVSLLWRDGGPHVSSSIEASDEDRRLSSPLWSAMTDHRPACQPGPARHNRRRFD